LSLILACKEPPPDAENNIFFQTTNDNVMAKQDTVRLNLSKNIDSIIIEYWNSFYANTFIFRIDNDSEISYIGKPIFDEEKTIDNLAKHNRLINYINQFYINKESQIVLSE